MGNGIIVKPVLIQSKYLQCTLGYPIVSYFCNKCKSFSRPANLRSLGWQTKLSHSKHSWTRQQKMLEEVMTLILFALPITMLILHKKDQCAIFMIHQERDMLLSISKLKLLIFSMASCLLSRAYAISSK